MTLEEDFMWVTGDALSEMRILVERTLVLFKNNAAPLTRLGAESNEHAARSALNDIGGALDDLRKIIEHLQEAHQKKMSACKLLITKNRTNGRGESLLFLSS